jgi:hypothetical protein
MSGMNPPSRIPRSDLVKKKERRPCRADWLVATMDQRDIWMGIQRSGPTALETSCEGSSDMRNEM